MKRIDESVTMGMAIFALIITFNIDPHGYHKLYTCWISISLIGRINLNDNPFYSSYCNSNFIIITSQTTKRTRRSNNVYGMVWYSMAWFGLLVLCKYNTMQNFGLLGLKMTELCMFKIFGMISVHSFQIQHPKSSNRFAK